ncbi:hypothetical protein [Mesorhizobium sp. M1B.F.Ca.ET.045.04.1.1]|uniref:hypothetical protein n=1 Tax=Mesorhizobium sp. M1B.F.Ca.ET.045.04.1.1 TaxID=2493673 RepID=UPI0016751242|nr:hypothetical protein [Mesorhizobium sp. M1B.F.Ca.ET.045.04.1.1]
MKTRTTSSVAEKSRNEPGELQPNPSYGEQQSDEQHDDSQRLPLRTERLPAWSGRSFSQTTRPYFFFTRWVSADAATDLTAFDVLFEVSNLPALDATFLLVVSLDFFAIYPSAFWPSQYTRGP